jgi:hypothetical protein
MSCVNCLPWLCEKSAKIDCERSDPHPNPPHKGEGTVGFRYHFPLPPVGRAGVGVARRNFSSPSHLSGQTLTHSQLTKWQHS